MTPPIVIIVLTFQRTEYALKTIESAIKHLKYPDLRWYVSDDGSKPEHYQSVMEMLKGQNVIGSHSEKLGYGGGANKAWHIAHEHADLTLFLEDDWNLERELDLTHYAKLLMDYRDIGMVRMGYLNLNMKGQCIGRDGHLYWLLDRNADSYVFTGHPSLRHRRYREAYGPYPEGLNPGNTELAYASQYRYAQFGGPEIVWPAELGEWGPFGHIGAVQSY